MNRLRVEEECLDERDRKILEVLYKYGRKGQSFNKLAEEVKPFVSRSTLATRLEKLRRLNYIEKLPGEKRGMVKIRATFQTRLIMWLVERAKEEADEIVSLILKKKEELSAKGELKDEDVEEFKRFLHKLIHERVNNLFTFVVYTAIHSGIEVAKDLCLPLLIDSFKKIVSAIESVSREFPVLAKPTPSINIGFKTYPPGTKLPQEAIQVLKSFFKKFGEDLLERAPESVRPSLKKLIEHPEEISKVKFFSIWRPLPIDTFYMKNEG